jgi:CBS domain-containing protein
MQVQEIMTSNPKYAEPSTSLQQVAQMMVDCDCGGIPVCHPGTKRLAGFITDRDIVCRTIAKGLNPLQMSTRDAMTTDVQIVTPDTSVDQVIRLMQQHKVRRLPVTNEQQELLGIVAQADIVRKATSKQPEMIEEFEEALEKISAPKASI